ncbi:ABC1 kinase family protein [Nocardioides marmoribigeumensis]|uniref:Unusual protein kinase regulating ubiquinone biosynthesis (AarF/ABC1/UbiB family) n=1 Tax=Nocardioides marmoribigeumensis TaxID=433649 RepID=A0ABU2BRZ0_9ACTN|nr:AarF/UbiB family protein [Nocardioides marmoribigeumensis]MDR7360749.1 putative unusual protein kinase regulating ubiquinone biosynthesis (AarF/ABC1/UbiB family) [Nocardioides marmoribigeumensis]
MKLRIDPAHATRYRQIALLLVRHGRGDLVKSAGIDSGLDEMGPDGDPAAAERLADDLEEMGPAFIKLGQLMSSRVDLLSPVYIEALSRLQDDVAPFSFEEVREIVADELQVRLSHLFPTFDPTPLAAASLGQVHRATMRDGREVVVKVQRPGIREQVRQDMEVLAELATFFDEHTETGRRFGFVPLLEEFRKALVDELDYRREADNLARMREMVAGQDLIVVPEPYPDLTTGKVLTMEFVEGRKVTDLGPLARLELDGAPLADQLFKTYLDQVLVEGVFHADPHPGNVFVTRDGRLVLLDIGMIARLAPAVRDKLVKLFLALADARPDEVTRIAITLGDARPEFDEAAFERAVADLVGRTADASVSDLDIGALVLQLTRTAGETGLRMDPELVMLGKTLLNLDQVAGTLDPDFQPRDALQRHMADLMRSSMRTTPASVMASMLEAKEFVEELPGRVNRAFDAVGKGNFELRIKAFDEDEFLHGLHKLANVLSAAVVLAAMILASALLARPSSDGSSVENRIALVVFVVAVLVSLGMLARIALTTRKVRIQRRG